jgi:chromosomal replication initiation ATPase DnaA
MIRPSSLSEFVGQENARRILGVLVTAAKRRNEPVPHLLMSGQSGLGKTTLARIVATEMNGRLIEMVGSSLKNTGEMTAQLIELQANDVLFIDELHALPRKLEEVHRLHDARHTNATLLLEASKDLRVVQKQLGHSRPTTTAVYADVVNERLVDAVNSMEMLAKRTMKEKLCNPDPQLVIAAA